MRRLPWLLPSPLLLALPLLLACQGDTPSTDGRTLREETIEGVRFLEIYAPGADQRSPLVVALHGYGGTPEGLARRLWPVLPAGCEVAMPQGFLSTQGGRSWFDWPDEMSGDEVAAATGAAEQRIWTAIAALARGRKVLVTGFSQGAVLTYALAARHPDEIAYAFPISGLLPQGLLPHGPARTAPVYALHGRDDAEIDLRDGRAAVAAFRAAGAVAELREFPGVGHDITTAMRDDLLAHLGALATKLRRPIARENGKGAPSQERP